MAFFNGPSTTVDGLLFCLDNKTPRGFKGEPMTNKVESMPSFGSYPSGIAFTYEYSCSIEYPPFDQDNLWVKFYKTSSTNGRACFLSGLSYTVGPSYTFSMFAYTNDTDVTQINVISDNSSNSPISSSNNYNTGNRGTVQRIYGQFTSTAGSSTIGIRGGASNAIGSTFWLTGFQVEESSYPTRFSVNDRSSTESFIDYVGGHIIDASEAIFDEDENVHFDGSSARINIENSLPLGNTFSISSWVNPSDPTGEKIIVGPPANGSDNWFSVNGTSAKVFWTETSDTNNDSLSGGTVPTGTWTHVGLTINGNYVELFVNGSSVASKTDIQTVGSWTSSNIKIGTRSTTGQSYFEGQIPHVSMYNRPLSESEMNKIYLSQRGRFD